MKEHAEEIKCTKCDMEQIAYVKETLLFNIYIHQCQKCGHLITESDWEKVTIKSKIMNKEHNLNNTETQALNIPVVVGSVSDIQYCKDCVNYPCNTYEKSAKCRTCSWNGRKQTKFEMRVD